MHHDSQTPAATETGGPGGTRRERNARGQGDRLRTEILDAVNRLFTEEARMRPLSLSMREVAREAGVTAPAIYRHFDNKEELARAAVAEGFALLAEAMETAEAEVPADEPAQRLAAQAHAYCRFAGAQRGYFRLMFRVTPGVFGEPLGAGPAAVVADRWRAAVERLRDHQELRISQTEQAAMSLWASVHGRLVLGPTVEGMWDLGDVHEFVDRMVATVVTPPK